jgi:uncharacterized protein with gpF-like domain
MWVAVHDSRTCNKCMELDGKVFHYSDDIWKDHLPPIHKDCRCRFRAFTVEDMADRCLLVSNSADYQHCFIRG